MPHGKRNSRKGKIRLPEHYLKNEVLTKVKAVNKQLKMFKLHLNCIQEYRGCVYLQ